MTVSILDNDQYKFTMQQALMRLGFASVPVEYKFKCRNKDVVFTNDMLLDIQQRINDLQTLKLTNDEMNFLKGIRYFSKEYLQFLKYYTFNPELVYVGLTPQTGELNIRISGGWFQTILFEVPILSIISEVYMRRKQANLSIGSAKLHEKVKLLEHYPDLKFKEFGTRRRVSFNFHDNLIGYLKEKLPSNFTGTSNLYLAMIHNVPSFGTMAHEWLQAHQQLKYRVADSQKMAFENWIKVYRGDLGIALADVINTDAFLKDFDDPFLYKLFDGVREDSEPDPFLFGHKIANFYIARGINPRNKSIIFSNGINFKTAIDLYKEFRNIIGVGFGIGTYLTNDTDIKPLNIVLKMIKCNGQPVAKISNAPGKSMCENEDYINYLKSAYNVK
jgi:nicotinate phosphoribosyltransferase